MPKVVKILDGFYAGREGVVLEEGTFNVFGREVVGIKVRATSCGNLILAHGEYEVVREIELQSNKFERYEKVRK